MLDQQTIHQVSVAPQAGEVFQIAGVGEFVEVDDGLIRLGAPVKHEIGTNEAGATCDDYRQYSSINPLNIAKHSQRATACVSYHDDLHVVQCESLGHGG